MAGTVEKKRLYKKASRFGIFLTEAQADLLFLFIDELIEWNSKINLVGISERERIINELVLDSMVPVPYLPEKGRMIDLGSGAGFPAVIIKILKPDLDVILVESNGKKVSFLKYAMHTLKLTDIIPINGRIETITEYVKALGFDMITSRAMTSLENIIRISYPFLKPGGTVIGFLGRDGENELKNIRKLLFDLNLGLKDSITYRLPGKKEERTTVIIQKESIPDPLSDLYVPPPF